MTVSALMSLTAAAASTESIETQTTIAPAAHATQEANIAFSTIDVVVRRNDTMDQLFHRLELNLADLASLRSLPELRSQVDRLKPGEMLRFMHRSY